jgi:hypothetical protein
MIKVTDMLRFTEMTRGCSMQLHLFSNRYGSHNQAEKFLTGMKTPMHRKVILNTNLDINYRQTYFENIKNLPKNISGKSRNFSK